MTSNRRSNPSFAQSIAACILTAASVSGAFAQTTPAATPAVATPAAAGATAAAPAAPAAAPALAISAPAAAPGFKALEGKKYSVSGILDGYVNYDGNNPSTGNTQLRNFDIRANTVSLTEAKVTLAYDPSPIGIRADVGLGSAFQIMHPANPSGTGLKYVEQMFVSVKPPKWKGSRRTSASS